MSNERTQRVRTHIKIRLIPLIRRLIHSSWRNKILYIHCADLATPSPNKCIVTTARNINHQSEHFQAILEDNLLPFEENFFDVVIIDLSLFNKKDHQQILSEAYRVLNFSGKALICSQNKHSVNFFFNLTNKVARSYFSLRGLLTKAKFQILTEHPLSFALNLNCTRLNQKLISYEKKLRKFLPYFANYHCIQVYKSKDYYQPLPDYLRLSKTLTITG